MDRARHAVVPMLALLALAGCGRDEAPAAPLVSAAQLDKQAIDAATAVERQYQDAIATGELEFLAECAPDKAQSIRLVEMAADDSLGYSLAVTADARGAVAIWQGIQRVSPGRYQAYGAQGMRMDGNGWRQLRQAVLESHFVTGYHIPDEDFFTTHPNHSSLIFCLDGKRRVARATDGASDLDRIAVRMRRLAGNYYSPPAHASE